MTGRIAIRIVIISTLYAVLLFLYASFTLTGSIRGAFSQWESCLFLTGVSVIGALVLYVILGRIKKKFSRKRLTGIPFLSQLALCIVIITGFYITGSILYKAVFLNGLPWQEMLETWPDILPKGFVISIVTGIVYPVIDYSLDAYGGLQKMQVEAKKIRTEQLNLRFESLRNQISPHFLFNSLNTISSLIYRDTVVAETFIRHLANLYRSVMLHYDSPTIPLGEELDLVRDYGFLMQTRFENAFTMDIDVPDHATVMQLPPLSVQMLVENAVKHNRLRIDHPLHVSLYIENNSLVVRNNYIGEPGHVKIGNDLYKKPGQRYQGGVGLKNIKNRYKFLTRKQISIRKDDHFTVSLPLLDTDDG